jgi:hypothetical protein
LNWARMIWRVWKRVNILLVLGIQQRAKID